MLDSLTARGAGVEVAFTLEKDARSGKITEILKPPGYLVHTPIEFDMEWSGNQWVTSSRESQNAFGTHPQLAKAVDHMTELALGYLGDSEGLAEEQISPRIRYLVASLRRSVVYNTSTQDSHTA